MSPLRLAGGKKTWGNIQREIRGGGEAFRLNTSRSVYAGDERKGSQTAAFILKVPGPHGARRPARVVRCGAPGRTCGLFQPPDPDLPSAAPRA